MILEHIACNVANPSELATWYVDHLAMQILEKREGGSEAHFMADSTGRFLLEIYHRRDAPVPDYASQNPFSFHIAFAVKDIAAVRDKLVQAGAHVVSEETNRLGNKLAMLRDPWGIPIQLAQRKVPVG